MPLLTLGACGNRGDNQERYNDSTVKHITDTFKTDTNNYTNGPDNAPPQADSMKNSPGAPGAVPAQGANVDSGVNMPKKGSAPKRNTK